MQIIPGCARSLRGAQESRTGDLRSAQASPGAPFDVSRRGRRLPFVLCFRTVACGWWRCAHTGVRRLPPTFSLRRRLAVVIAAAAAVAPPPAFPESCCCCCRFPRASSCIHLVRVLPGASAPAALAPSGGRLRSWTGFAACTSALFLGAPLAFTPTQSGGAVPSGSSVSLTHGQGAPGRDTPAAARLQLRATSVARVDLVRVGRVAHGSRAASFPLRAPSCRRPGPGRRRRAQHLLERSSTLARAPGPGLLRGC